MENRLNNLNDLKGIKKYMKKETDLINDEALRNQCIEHYEVLEKVKQLLLIPGTDFMSVKQVAAYYEVGIETIQSLYKDYKNELDEDGVAIRSYKDLLIVLKGQLKIGQGKTTVYLGNGSSIEGKR